MKRAARCRGQGAVVFARAYFRHGERHRAPAAAADHRQGARRAAGDSASRTGVSRRVNRPIHDKGAGCEETKTGGRIHEAQNGAQRHWPRPRPAVCWLAPPSPPIPRSRSGCSLPLTGRGFHRGRQELTGALKVYTQQHGDTVAGRKIELIVRDDARGRPTTPAASFRR